ncbi:major facilitator superfamily domain-containing protein [Aspergillus candidus]|uniref:Major facilitator superfamily domain-containing protein n=1 Tax=Aspergillus candidus TaxID=41067 RepID=A0A2I2F2X5_ASPCN|nr:major facilitator superfamily domain-containing protein [Aspergillus candidus]PLB34983.1 major facilitator superfamily domain-containing protein [Aspergillus candidus]
MSDSNGEKSRIGPNPEIPPQPKPAAGFSPPPDGGLLAWTNTYYESGALFAANSSNIFWVGSIAAFMLLFVGLFPRVQPPKARAMIDRTALTDVSYMAFVLSSLIIYMGLFVILFYFSYYSAANEITDESLAFYLVPILNATSIFGRTIPNKLADKTGPFNLLVPASLISGLLMLCMMAVSSKGTIVVMALLSGFMSGALIGLPPVCLAMLTADKSRLGMRIGMGYTIIVQVVLISGPSSGAILRNGGASLDWRSLWKFGGVPTCVTGLIYAAIRIAKYGPGLMVKA